MLDALQSNSDPVRGYDPADEKKRYALWQADVERYRQMPFKQRRKGSIPLPPIPLQPDKDYGFYLGDLHKVIQKLTYLTEQRLYFRSAPPITERAGVLYIVFFLGPLALAFIGGFYYITGSWLFTSPVLLLFGILPALWAIRAYYKAPPLPQVHSLHVLDRTTGKLYVAREANQPHYVYDFFRSYFYIHDVSNGIDKPLFLIRIKTQPEAWMSEQWGYISDAILFDDGFHSVEDAFKAFYALVWFMDQRNVWGKSDYKFLQNLTQGVEADMKRTAEKRQQMGITPKTYFQGIFHPDGRIEGVGPITHYLQNDIVTDDPALQRNSDAAWEAYYQAHPEQRPAPASPDDRPTTDNAGVQHA